MSLLIVFKSVRRILAARHFMQINLRRARAQTGVDTVRTMLARNDELNMAFFRSQGMMGGPFIQLEMPLEPPRKRAEG